MIQQKINSANIYLMIVRKKKPKHLKAKGFIIYQTYMINQSVCGVNSRLNGRQWIKIKKQIK